MNSAISRSFCAMAAVVSLLTSCSSSPPPKPGASTTPVFKSGSRSQLALGTEAVIKEPIEVPFNGTMDLNFKTREEVVNIRRNMALRGNLGQLLVGGVYKPSEVFADLADEKPWISLKARTLQLFGSGVDVTDGQAKESRFICSPYLLIAPDLRLEKMPDVDRNRFSLQKLASSQFPMQCPPRKIILDPVNATEEVTYDVSGFRNEINAYLRTPIQLDKIAFSLVAYNARDFGYYWFYVKPEPDSSKLKKIPHWVRTASNINQILALSSGTWNDMKGDTEEMQRWSFTGVPAKMVILLWKNKPADVSDKADFTVTFNFN
ncbi:MAG: hypothetical protein K2W95_23080 [Candidatus Obscuribacterales bacterium]|nr:hypothetical protein [Candidatus Obscuribacterales bacterium]